MKVKRTEQIWIKQNDSVSNLSHISKNLYNEANYSIRQEFIKNGKYISYKELFRSAMGKIINSDVQGSYNIGFKAFPETFTQVEVDRMEDVGLHPLKHSFIKNRWTSC